MTARSQSPDPFLVPSPPSTTGNDFSTLYAPLIRDGRMEKFYWNPTREDRVGVCMGIFMEDNLDRSEVETLVDGFPGQSIDFFGALRARVYDDKVGRGATVCWCCWVCVDTKLYRLLSSSSKYMSVCAGGGEQLQSAPSEPSLVWPLQLQKALGLTVIQGPHQHPLSYIPPA